MGGGPPGFTRGSTSLALLWYASQRGAIDVAYGAVTLCGPLSSRFRYRCFCNPSRRPQPRPEGRFGLCPRSLAATDGIDVSFCSSGYLDVSVPRVRSRTAYAFGGGYSGVTPSEFPHSDISGSTLVCQLPGAYRRLPRLSSLLDAQTSTMHP